MNEKEMWRRLCVCLLAAVKAKDDFLACYRIGKQPSEALFKRLDKAKQDIELATAALGEVKP